MTWQDRDYADDPSHRLGRPGGDWQGVRPTFDNPMTWSVPLVRIFDISIRVHVVFLIYIIIELARSLAPPAVGTVGPTGWALTGLVLGALFAVVLVHEIGHCVACRWVRGEAHEILMWPLGGLAYCRPPQRWQAHFITAAGGPMVNVIIFVILAPVLGLATGRWWGLAIPNPLGIGQGFAVVSSSWWLLGAYSVHAMSFVILLFNLMPIFPLDGGRLFQAILWPRCGYARSMRLAVYAGYFGAIALGIVGAVNGSWMLIGIAIFGGVTCYMTVKQLEWTESMVGDEADLFAASRWGYDEAPAEEAEVDPSERRSRRERRHAESEAAESEAVDRILAKIAEHGMASLNGREQRLLKRETDRRKREQA